MKPEPNPYRTLAVKIAVELQEQAAFCFGHHCHGQHGDWCVEGAKTIAKAIAALDKLEPGGEPDILAGFDPPDGASQ